VPSEPNVQFLFFLGKNFSPSPSRRTIAYGKHQQNSRYNFCSFVENNSATIREALSIRMHLSTTATPKRRKNPHLSERKVTKSYRWCITRNPSKNPKPGTQEHLHLFQQKKEHKRTMAAPELLNPRLILLGTKLSLSSRGRMTLGVGAIF
jgi:hypothetical protein